MVKLDDLSEKIKSCILVMAKEITGMYITALEALENNDKEKALQVIQMDEYINRKEEEVNDLAIEALALLSPVASDLRKVLAGIKIASDLERIGDYAKTISFFTVRNDKIDPEVMEKTKQMGDVFLVMFDHVMESYDQSNVEWAMTIPEEDLMIDHLFEEIVKILEKKISKQHQVDSLIPVLGMLRNLKRAGEHAKNICEHIVFEVKGQHIEFN